MLCIYFLYLFFTRFNKFTDKQTETKNSHALFDVLTIIQMIIKKIIQISTSAFIEKYKIKVTRSLVICLFERIQVF